MTETPKTQDKLWAWRDYEAQGTRGRCVLVFTNDSSDWVLKDDALVGKRWRAQFGTHGDRHFVPWEVFELLCPHLKLKPGEGPIEVKPWPDVPTPDDVTDAVCQAMAPVQKEAAVKVRAFITFFQESTK